MKLKSWLLVGLLFWAAVMSSEAEEVTSKSYLSVPPYVQALSPDSVVVHWRTGVPSYGWVEYGLTRDLGQREDEVQIFGLRQANQLQQRVILKNLIPGTNYWYRICTKSIESFGPYKIVFGPEVKSEITPLHTLPAKDQSLHVAIFNDQHLHLDTFRRLAKTAEGYPIDFSLFNGDCMTDLTTEQQAITNFVVYLQGVHAESHPAMFVRGNHETRGAFARLLPNYVDWPHDQPYFAFNAGAVRFLVLDCGEDKADTHREYSGLVDFESFRDQETQWLKSELKSPEWEKARWHVLVHHIPLYWNNEKGTCSATCLKRWGALLAEAHIDLAINAHTHKRIFFEKDAVKNPYPVAVGGAFTPQNATVMILQADSKELHLRMLDIDGRDIYPEFMKKK